MKLVIIESPYAGHSSEIERNLTYVRAAMKDCLLRGEAPYASHALYTQPGVLDDLKPEERRLGISAGFAWSDAFEGTGHGNDVVLPLIAFYADYGFSNRMNAALTRCQVDDRRYEIRYLYKDQDV